jgi:hypothetical protein
MDSKRIDFLLILLIILVSIGLQAYFINPPVISDQLDYFFFAKSFFSEPLAISHRSLRLGLIIPTAIFIKIFGYSEAAYYAMAFIGLAALAAGTYLVALKLFSRLTAVLSTLLVIVMPNILKDAGHLLPDIPAAGLAVLAIGILATLNPGKSVKENNSSGWLCFTAGLLLGWAYLVREFVLFIFPMVIILFWIRRRPFIDLIWVMLGALFMASLEWVYCWNFYGNPFARFISAQPRGTAGAISLNIYQIATYLPRLISKYGSDLYSLLLFLAITYNFYRSIQGRKENIFILTWFLMGYFLLTLTGLFPVIMKMPDKVLLRLHLFRYWMIIITPMVIGGVVALQELLVLVFARLFPNGSGRRLATSSVMVFITALTLVQSCQSLSKNEDAVINGNDAYQEFRGYIRTITNPDETLWLERGFRRASERIVPIYLKTFFGKNLWSGEIRYLNNGNKYKGIDELKEGLIVTNTYFNNPVYFTYPDYLLNIPKTWPLEFISENGEVTVHRIIR